MKVDDTLEIKGFVDVLKAGWEIETKVGDRAVKLRHDLSERQVAIVRASGIINKWKADHQ